MDAYSDTTAVTSCSRLSEYVKWWVLSVSSFSGYTAPRPTALGTALGKRLNILGLTFFIRFFNFFSKFLMFFSFFF